MDGRCLYSFRYHCSDTEKLQVIQNRWRRSTVEAGNGLVISYIHLTVQITDIDAARYYGDCNAKFVNGRSVPDDHVKGPSNDTTYCVIKRLACSRFKQCAR